MQSYWRDIYDNWLQEGDLKMLMYIQKIQRYLDHGRSKTKQERLNLIAQIHALLELKYNGLYRHLTVRDQDNKCLHTVAYLLKPSQHIQNFGFGFGFESIVKFLENPNQIRIKPQPVEQFQTHPLWILWTTLLLGAQSDEHKTAITVYRNIFMHYMQWEDYVAAAKIYQCAQDIRIRVESLPLLHPYVLQKVMYVNIDTEQEPGA